MLKSFRELEVWQKSHRIVLEIYRVTSIFPKDERFGIVAQLRRAAYSIPANIAEGFGRRSTKELIQCLAIANGSLEEVRYFIYLSSDLGYLAKHEFEEMDKKLIGAAQMIAALSRSLKNRMGPAVASSRVTGHGSRITRAPAQAN
jgi:four helix bundle protein